MQRLEQGVSVAQLARDYQVAVSTIRRTVRIAREQVGQSAHHIRRPGNIVPTEWAGILARLDRGETQAQVAQSYAVSARTIGRLERLARAQGVVAPRSPYRRWRIPPAEWSALLERMQEGVAHQKIAEAYGVSLPTLRKVYRAACTTLQTPLP